MLYTPSVKPPHSSKITSILCCSSMCSYSPHQQQVNSYSSDQQESQIGSSQSSRRGSALCSSSISHPQCEHSSSCVAFAMLTISSLSFMGLGPIPLNYLEPLLSRLKS